MTNVTHGRFQLHCLALSALWLCQPAWSAVTVTGGSGASMVNSSTTGVYELAKATVGTKTYITRGLICNGTVRDVHTTNGGAGTLARAPGAPAIKVIASTMDTLVAQGGLNSNAQTKPAAVQSLFNSACATASRSTGGGSVGGGASPRPLSVPRNADGTCPPGYILGAPSKSPCHLTNFRAPTDRPVYLAEARRSFAAFAFALMPMGQSHAMLLDLHRRIFVTFTGIGTGFGYSYTPVDGVGPGYPANTRGVVEFSGAGHTVQWLVPN